MEIVGWVGSSLLALCAVPLAWQTFRQKHADGISWAFLAMWFIGEVLTTIYILPKRDYPLLMNYGLNIACLLVVMRYKITTR